MASPSTASTPSLDTRGQFIATRKRALFDALVADLGLEGERAAEAAGFYELLVALIHHRFLRELELLHDAYHVVDPGEPPGGDAEAVEAAYATVSSSLERVLRAGNFVEVDAALVAAAQTSHGRLRTPLRNGADDFRELRLFRRGEHRETLVRKSFYGLRKQTTAIDVYDEVVLLAAMKPAPEPSLEPSDGSRARRRPRKPPARHGSVMIKYFHDIAVADLDALYPGAQVVLSLGDKLSLGLPALVAGIPLAIKIIPALLVLYGLARFYLGERPPDEASLGEALVVAGALIALGGFLTNQWTKFQRRALLHQRAVNDMIYFHNITNNVGIFDHIIHHAEEQDAKEALLAYFTLLAEGPLDQAALDARIETWLQGRLNLDLDFEVDDALGKLEALGLLRRDGERLAVLPLPEALAVLDRHWDDLFAYAQSPGNPAFAPRKAVES